MAKLFNRLRKKLLESNNFKEYLKYAVGEIILVVLGILIAIQLDNVSDEFKMQREAKTYMQSFKADLEADIEALQEHRIITTGNKKAAENLISLINSNKPLDEIGLEVIDEEINDTLILINSISRAGFLWYPEINDFTLTDLESSGRTASLKKKELKKAVLGYYSDMEKYNDWELQKNEAQRIYQNIQASIIDPSLRILTNYSKDSQLSYIREHPVDIEKILLRIRNHEEIESALNAMIYSQERLLLESQGREKLAQQLISVLDEALNKSN